MKSTTPLLLALLALPAPASAADWVALPSAGTADQYYYDRSKLTIKDDEISYWKKVVFKSPQNLHGREVASGLLRERIHCAEHTAKLVSYLYYSASGETVEYVAQDESEPAPVIPDTIGDAFERALCPLVWHKQEEARIKAEQKAAETNLSVAKKEIKKNDADKAEPKQPADIIQQQENNPRPSNSLPMPQIIEQLY